MEALQFAPDKGQDHILDKTESGKIVCWYLLDWALWIKPVHEVNKNIRFHKSTYFTYS